MVWETWSKDTNDVIPHLYITKIVWISAKPTIYTYKKTTNGIILDCHMAPEYDFYVIRDSYILDTKGAIPRCLHDKDNVDLCNTCIHLLWWKDNKWCNITLLHEPRK